MPRYIDADAFEADCRKRYCTDCDNYNGVKCRACWVDDMLGEVEDAPTISPNEVRGVGHWVTEKEAIDANDYSLRDTCSVCGHCDWDCTESMSFKYCPSCGARMEVSEDA